MPSDPREPPPPGFNFNSPDQLEKLRTVVRKVYETLGSEVPALALVVVMPDTTVTAGLIGDARNLEGLATLLDKGPEVLRQTVTRLLTGKGKTEIVPINLQNG